MAELNIGRLLVGLKGANDVFVVLASPEQFAPGTEAIALLFANADVVIDARNNDLKVLKDMHGVVDGVRH